MLELEMRILSELEELRAENVVAMMNTVVMTKGDAGQIAEACLALEELTQSGLIRMAIDYNERKKLRSASVEESMAIIRAIPGNVHFDAGKGLWLWSSLTLPLKLYDVPIPEILVTSEGLAKARSILEERGYQWWRQKR